MSDHAVGLDMPNGLSPEIKYPQKFVQVPNQFVHGPSNNAAKKAPSLAETMKGIDRK